MSCTRSRFLFWTSILRGSSAAARWEPHCKRSLSSLLFHKHFLEFRCSRNSFGVFLDIRAKKWPSLSAPPLPHKQLGWAESCYCFLISTSCLQTSKAALGATCFNSWSESSIGFCKDHRNSRQGTALCCTCTHLFFPVSCNLPVCSQGSSPC